MFFALLGASLTTLLHFFLRRLQILFEISFQTTWWEDVKKNHLFLDDGGTTGPVKKNLLYFSTWMQKQESLCNLFFFGWKGGALLLRIFFLLPTKQSCFSFWLNHMTLQTATRLCAKKKRGNNDENTAWFFFFWLLIILNNGHTTASFSDGKRKKKVLFSLAFFEKEKKKVTLRFVTQKKNRVPFSMSGRYYSQAGSPSRTPQNHVLGSTVNLTFSKGRVTNLVITLFSNS